MPVAPYERYGLTGNPFRDLSSENLDDVRIYHVNQKVDEALRTIRDEVLEKENRAIVAIVGPHGAGKSERLLVTAAEARLRTAFVVNFDVTTTTPYILRGIGEAFDRSAKEAGLVKAFAAPSWLRSVQALAKLKESKYDPTDAGRILANALNESAPSFLLLNDLHNLTDRKEVDQFSLVLQTLADSIKPGVMVVLTCYPNYLLKLKEIHPSVASRLNRLFILAALSDDEAGLLIAKKLLAKRLVENLEPTYPFDRGAITALNSVAGGNPRRLLEVADLALEKAVSRRAYRVDEETVRGLFPAKSPTVAPPAPAPGSPAPSSSPTSQSRPAVPSVSTAGPLSRSPMAPHPVASDPRQAEIDAILNAGIQRPVSSRPPASVASRDGSRGGASPARPPGLTGTSGPLIGKPRATVPMKTTTAPESAVPDSAESTAGGPAD